MTARILALPRFVRVLLVGLVSLCWVMAVFPLVDRLYLTFFYNPSTTDLPAYLSVGLGLVAYLVGWWSLVGARWGKMEPTRLAQVYIWLGLSVFVFCASLIGFGLAMLDVFAG